MDFDDLLALTGVAEKSKAPNAPRPAPPRRPPSTVARPTTPSGAAGSKRKAEVIERSNGSARSQKRPQLSDYTSSSQPYQNTSGQSQAPKPNTSTSTPQPVLTTVAKTSAAPTKSSASTAAQANPKPKQVAPAPQKPPIKGSFEDIKNRALALQAKQPAIVTPYVNKRTVPRLPSERPKPLPQQRGGPKSAPTSRPGSGKSPSSKPGNAKLAGTGAVREKPTPKPEPPTYRGTGRPVVAPSSIPKSSAHAKITSKPSVSKKSTVAMPASRARYEYSDDEAEDGYGDSEGYESSDMEAGVHELDEEEEMALRQARREDMAAKREEEELRRRKLLRKGRSGEI